MPAASNAQAAAPANVDLYLNAFASLDQHEIAALALTLGVVLFAVVTSIMLVRTRQRAATAEIARSQVWQWIRHPRGVLDDGRRVTVGLFRTILGEELARLQAQHGAAAFAAGQFERAASLLDRITTAEKFEAFLTLPAYQALA